MDLLPFVTPVYKRDLDIENYFIGYLKHPYLSFYTGRGCKSRCTFCLWPQTVGGHRYRTRSVGHVIDEVDWAEGASRRSRSSSSTTTPSPTTLPRAEAIARGLGKLGVAWSCNAKANVPRETLEGHASDNGLRLLLVGYECGNQQILHNIKKGMLVDVASRFTKDCHELGIVIHGTFILGLPGETHETIKETIEFAKEINPHTIQVSLAAPYPGTFLYKQAHGERLARRRQRRSGQRRRARRSRRCTIPICSTRRSSNRWRTSTGASISAPRRSPRSSARWSLSPEMMKRRLQEGVEFFRFLSERREVARSEAARRHGRRLRPRARSQRGRRAGA